MKNPVDYQANVSLSDLYHMVDRHVHDGHALVNLQRKAKGKGKQMDDPVLTELLRQLDLKTEELRADVLDDPIRGYLPSGLWADKWERASRDAFIAMGKKVLDERQFYWYAQEKKRKLYWTRKGLRLGKKKSGGREASPAQQIRIPLSPAQVLFYQARLDACVTELERNVETLRITEEIKGFFPAIGKRVLLQTADVPDQPISGRELLGLDVHYDSGIWHIDVLLSKAREYEPEKAKKMGIPIDRKGPKEPLHWLGLAPYRAGKKELGLKGKWAVGAQLQHLAGHQFSGEEAEMFESSKAIQKERYEDKEGAQSPDGLALDVGLATEMWNYAKGLAEEAGQAKDWEAACARYRRWLIEVQPLKDQIYARASAITGNPVRDRLDDAKKQRFDRVEGAISGLSQVLGMHLDPKGMRSLTKVHPLRKIAGALEDKWTDIPTLCGYAQIGLAKLIQYLTDLFTRGGRQRHIATPGPQPVLATPTPTPATIVATDLGVGVAEVVEEPVRFESSTASEKDLAWFKSYQAAFALVPHFVAGRELAQAARNVADGRMRASGLTQDEAAQAGVQAAALEAKAKQVLAEREARAEEALPPSRKGMSRTEAEAAINKFRVGKYIPGKYLNTLRGALMTGDLTPKDAGEIIGNSNGSGIPAVVKLLLDNPGMSIADAIGKVK